MKNEITGAYRFEADGKSYVMKVGANAMCQLESRYEKSIVDLATDLQSGNVQLLLIRDMFAFSLVPQVGQQDAGDIIDSLGVQEAGRILGEAFALAFPPDESDASGEGQPGLG